MVIRLCVDSKVEIYLVSCLSKADTHVAFISTNDITAKEHFSGRKVGIVEAVYDIMGYHKHQTSLNVIYIDTTMSHIEQTRQLKSAEVLANIKPGLSDIFTRIHLQKHKK